MENKFVDTDVFLRYLTKEDPSKYERCREMISMTGRSNENEENCQEEV